MATLQLLEYADHRGGRRGSDAPEPLAFGFRPCLLEPGGVARLQPFLAEGVVGGDLLDVDADDVEQERGDESGAILAAHAVDDHCAFGSSRNRGDGGGDVRAEPL